MNPRSHPKSAAKRTSLVILVVLVAALLAGVLYFTSDAGIYRIGEALMESGNYQEALATFEKLPQYEYATQMIPLCYYELGVQAKLEEDYAAARDYYALAGSFSDAPDQVLQMTYSLGHEAFVRGNYEEADKLFAQLEGPQTQYGDPHFQTIGDASEYLWEQLTNQTDSLSFYIGDPLDEDFDKSFRNEFPCLLYNGSILEEEKHLIIDDIHYYPADRILYARRSGDTSRLTQEEQAVLTLAETLVATAAAESSSLFETELWLHDWLCSQITYSNPNMDVEDEAFLQLRELTCVGALLDGKANCQGYADAFYLLGTMAGLDIGRIFGDSDGNGHIWNTITLEGQNYIVDVTFDDISGEETNGWYYTYFNTFWDPTRYTPYGEEAIHPTVTSEPDLSQSYFAHTDQLFTDLQSATDSMVRQYVKDNVSWTYALVEGTDVDQEALDSALDASIHKSVWYSRTFSWYQWLETYGGNTYLILYWQ